MGQSGFRFEDNDMFMDVKATFRERIQDHMTTGDATKAVCEEYEEALADDDDALFVITALADAQMDIGRILVSTQKRCLKAIDYELSGQYDRGWAPEDQEEFTNTLLGFRKLVEQGKRKPQPKRTLARCTWQPGDVYALPLTGKKAEQYGISGRYLLIRMVDTFCYGRRIYPYVYLSVTASTEIPKTEADIAAATYLQINYKRVYRIVIVSRSQEEFDSANFQYIGNFPYLLPPAEVIIPQEELRLYRSTTLVSMLIDTACDKYSFYILGKEL